VPVAAKWSGAGAKAQVEYEDASGSSCFLRKTAAAQCTGQRWVVPAPGQKHWTVAAGCLGLPTPPLSPVRDKIPPVDQCGRILVSRPHSDLLSEAKKKEATRRSALLPMRNLPVYPNRYWVYTGLQG
jgi:hypothetical protein